MKEIWKQVSGNSNYQVSNLGRVKSNDQKVWNGKTFYMKKGRILKPGSSKGGYQSVVLNGKTNSVHRLVAIAFIPNPNNLPCINHKDENPRNNNVSNLEWCSYGYNNQYGSKPYRVYSKTRNSHKTSIPVVCVDIVTGKETEYASMSEAFRQTGAYVCHISLCCRGIREIAGGYRWKYKFQR